MLIQLILLQAIAHLLGDFMLQTESLSANKRDMHLKSHIFHVLLIGVISYLLAFDWGFWWASIAIMLTHLGIDLIKSQIYSVLKRNNKLGTFFFVDQLIHLAIILIVVLIYESFNTITFYLTIPEPKILATIIAFIFCMKPSNIIILNLFSLFNIQTPTEENNSDENKSLENAGKLIGIMERMIALVLIINLQYEAVGLVIAAKSILRFSSTAKSEYVLMGTLLSFGIAIFCGIILNLI